MLLNEKQYKEKLVRLGCIICRMPPELHHVNIHTGLGKKADYLHLIPLCPLHHRLGNRGTAIHAGRKSWQWDEVELLEQVQIEMAQYGF